MRMKKNDIREKVNKTEALLIPMLEGLNLKSGELNVRYGLLNEDKDFNVRLSKQMTLDYYQDVTDEDTITSFPVLDVVINKRAFTPSKGRVYPETPSSLALSIYRKCCELLMEY